MSVTIPVLFREHAIIQGGTAQPKMMKIKLSPRRTHKLLTAGQAIKEYPLNFKLGHMASSLVQCTLPHSNPGDVRIYMRRNGEWTLTVQPGFDVQNNRFYDVPHGTLPRLILVWIANEVVRTGDPVINLGGSLLEFMRELGVDPRSGGTEGRQRFRESMESLFAARINWEQISEDGTIKKRSRDSMEVVSNSSLWWNDSDPDAAPGWASWIKIGQNLFDNIRQHAVPCDTRALKELKHSALALDLYMLCNWHAFQLNQKKGKPYHWISWAMLAQQMGVDYKSTKDLKKRVHVAMIQVQQVYSGLKFSYDNRKGGLVIYPSPTAIPQKVEPQAQAS